MITPLTTAPLAAANATRAENYTDEGKQAVHSTTDANAENIIKQSNTHQSDINNAQLSQDTVVISDEARELLQKTVGEAQKDYANQHNAGQEGFKNAAEPPKPTDKEVKEAEENIQTGPSQEASQQSEGKDTITKLREQLKEAEKELQKAMENLSAAQAKANSANTEQGQRTQTAEVEAAQQQVLSAQQKVQIIHSQILEAEKGLS